jgi:hypothetical protein
MRQSLYKATGGNTSKWFYFFHLVLWADWITVRKGLDCSPFFMAGAHPILPLDIEEATWLVDLLGSVDRCYSLQSASTSKTHRSC